MRGSTKLRNTPVIIKYSFQSMTAENLRAVYACINYNEAYAPEEIADRSIVIDGDAGEIISRLSDDILTNEINCRKSSMNCRS